MAAPASLAEALAQLQAQMPAVGKHATADVKNKDGRKLYDYSYAPGETITPVLYPLMAAVGLSFTAAPTLTPDGTFVLAYSLRHTGGEQIDAGYPLPDPARYGPQDLGKAITYARRYALCALVGLFPGGDDSDANGMSEPKQLPRTGTNDQLRGQGRMDRAQKAAHEKLAADTKRPPRGQKAERSRPSAPDPDDPWAQDAPVTHERAADLRETIPTSDPEDQPGSILPRQHRGIEMLLTRRGIALDDRAQRHASLCGMLGLDEMPPSPETGQPSMMGLSFSQAADALKMMQEAPADA